MLKKSYAVTALSSAIVLTGCSNLSEKITGNTTGKNLDMSGYVMLAEAEAANPQTATPQGRLIIGNLSYKSRKVGIPADQKTPSTGSFRAVSRSTLLGTSETVVEYDFTAANSQDLQMIVKKMAAEINAVSAQTVFPQ